MIPHRKRAKALLTRKGRAKHGQTLIEGVRLIEDAVAAGANLTTLYHQAPSRSERLDRLVADAAARGIECAEVSAEEIAEIADTDSPQGCVALAAIPHFDAGALDVGGGDVLLLDGVRDPGNVGTLLRTAEAAGARGVITLSGSVEISNPKTVRASMGAYFRIPWIENVTMDRTVELCRGLHIPLILTDVNGGEAASAIRDDMSLGIVLGSEAGGYSDGWNRFEPRTIHIPMHGPAESLNVAAAGAVLLFRSVWRG